MGSNAAMVSETKIMLSSDAAAKAKSVAGMIALSVGVGKSDDGREGELSAASTEAAFTEAPPAAMAVAANLPPAPEPPVVMAAPAAPAESSAPSVTAAPSAAAVSVPVSASDSARFAALMGRLKVAEEALNEKNAGPHTSRIKVSAERPGCGLELRCLIECCCTPRL
jgi:cell division septation protein DedD